MTPYYLLFMHALSSSSLNDYQEFTVAIEYADESGHWDCINNILVINTDAREIIQRIIELCQLGARIVSFLIKDADDKLICTGKRPLFPGDITIQDLQQKK